MIKRPLKTIAGFGREAIVESVRYRSAFFSALKGLTKKKIAGM